MLASAAHPWVFLVIATTQLCAGSLIPGDGSSPPGTVGVTRQQSWEEDRTSGVQRPGYVRLPVKRHMFNGTGSWPWGFHWSPPPYMPPPPMWPSGPGSPGATPPPWPTGPMGPPGPGWPSGIPSPPPGWPTGPMFPPPPRTSQPGSPVQSAAPTYSQPPPRNPITKRWGWEHLADLGGIAYVIERGSYLFPDDGCYLDRLLNEI